MSIINDALKKVQSSLTNSPEKKLMPGDTPGAMTNGPAEFSAAAVEPQTPPPAPATVTAAAATSPKAKTSRMIYIVGALCLLIALFAPVIHKQSVFELIIHPLQKKSTVVAPPPVVAPPQTDTTIAQKAAAIKDGLTKSIVSFNNPRSSSKTSSRANRKIAVSGIMSQGETNVALIDGQVYEAGETVNGAKIIQINPNNIMVEENGEQRTVKVTGQ